jgi:hypothetical protein
MENKNRPILNIGDKVQNAVQGKTNWEKPCDGWIKCNVYASFLKEEKKCLGCCSTGPHGEHSTISLGWHHSLPISGNGKSYCMPRRRLGLANCTSNLIIGTYCISVLESFREL